MSHVHTPTAETAQENIMSGTPPAALVSQCSTSTGYRLTIYDRDMIKTSAYAAQTASSPLAPFSLDRRDPGPSDIQIDILYCGVCHSDLHTAKNEWKQTMYPCVPGHEIVGRVVKTGNKVTKFKEGDIA